MNIAEVSHYAAGHEKPVPFGVSEVILADGFGGHNTILLTILAHLTNQTNERWVTWIGPQVFHRKTLENAGINLGKLRVIHCNESSDNLWLFWEALANGKSDTVIAAPGQLSESELQKLSQAANQGKTQGLIVRHR